MWLCLLESYRNHNGQVWLLTMLILDFLDELSDEQLNAIQKILTAKVANLGKPLFELPYSDDAVVLDYVKPMIKGLRVKTSGSTTKALTVMGAVLPP